jgi:PPOX class probable F420-dependent enzyme
VDRALLSEARRAVLATIAADGRPRLVPITFAFAPGAQSAEPLIYSVLDEKPKSVADPRDLARVRDIRERPRVGVLIDRWDEDWRHLAWLRLDGLARLIEPADPPSGEHSAAIRLLRARYPQYSTMAIERRPMIRVAIERVTRWSAALGS